MAERLHDSDGVLNDDRIRNTVIENHRRTTAAITATTSAIAAATAEFRRDAKKIIQALSAQSKAMESVQKGLVQTQKSLSTTQTQFHELEKYGNVYRADQWQSQRDEPNYNELRGRTGENLNRTAVSLVRSSQSAAEFARNVRTIEANIIQMKERKMEMEQPQPKQDRGMSWGM